MARSYRGSSHRSDGPLTDEYQYRLQAKRGAPGEADNWTITETVFHSPKFGAIGRATRRTFTGTDYTKTGRSLTMSASTFHAEVCKGHDPDVITLTYATFDKLYKQGRVFDLNQPNALHLDPEKTRKRNALLSKAGYTALTLAGAATSCWLLSKMGLDVPSTVGSLVKGAWTTGTSVISGAASMCGSAAAWLRRSDTSAGSLHSTQWSDLAGSQVSGAPIMPATDALGRTVGSLADGLRPGSIVSTAVRLP